MQGRRKVWKFGGACSTVVGIICPPGWDRVNCSSKHWGGLSPQSPPPPGPLCDGPEVLLSFGQIEEAILHGILKPKTRLQARAFKSKYYVVMINHKNKIRIYEGLASFLELTNSQQEVLKQLSYYRVSQLNLLQIKRLLSHQKCTFKS